MYKGEETGLKTFFRNPWIRLFLVLDVFAVILIIGLIIFDATKTSIISFNITPIDSKISVDGDTSYYNGSFRIHPGEHQVVISHDGLDSKTFDINLESHDAIVVSTFLSENGNVDYYERKENQTSLDKLIEIASKEKTPPPITTRLLRLSLPPSRKIELSLRSCQSSTARLLGTAYF